MKITKAQRRNLLFKILPEKKVDVLFGDLQNEIKQIPTQKDYSQAIITIYREIKSLSEKINSLPSQDGLKKILLAEIKSIESRLVDFVKKSDIKEAKDFSAKIESLTEEIAIVKRMSNRGGSINRQNFVGGTNPLTKYTDINWKAGTNITLTTANDEANKRVNITITGSGGGSGITRSILSISSDTTAAAVAAVDYVYLVSGTTTLTLPDATANTNLYTIKNVGTGTVTVNTTSSQTIDGSLTAILPIQYTAIEVESDGTNWNIT